MVTKTEWGWTTYKHLHWVVDGRGYYEGRFKKDNDPYSWTLQVVRFLAHHPKKAMSAIINSDLEPRTFEGKIIN